SRLPVTRGDAGDDRIAARSAPALSHRLDEPGGDRILGAPVHGSRALADPLRDPRLRRPGDPVRPATGGLNGVGHTTNGRGSLPCTEKQVRVLYAFSRRTGVELTEELRRRFGLTTAEELSRRQAREAIDGLKERAGT
ncbi:hypothetical protein, partial [Alienimonas sp. DA493]|uniref:hypothetical protein n=1 Tax=Alienimonas sp. DA493 TaxID=3373605 RepID=UPI0037542979